MDIRNVFLTCTRHDHQVHCLYPKDKFKRKLDRHQKRILAAATVRAVQKSDYEKFMQPSPEYSIEEITEKSRYPIPLINETSNRLSKASIFTKLDVIAAFNKIRIKAGQEWMTAFNTRYGRFEYLVLPFGLCNAPSTFQSYVNKSLREFLDQFVTAYLDDILVYSDNEEEHEQQVLKVVRKLHERDLHLEIDKCEFSVSEVKYLGMYVGKDGIRI